MPETPSLAYLAAVLVVVCVKDGTPHILVVKRGGEANRGKLCLPGGHLQDGEWAMDAAVRETLEETGINVGRWPVRAVGVDDDPIPSPRGRYVTFSFVSVLPTMPTPTAGDDARAVMWLPVDGLKLAFDHNEIVDDALDLVDL